jgi:hypothetical protein
VDYDGIITPWAYLVIFNIITLFWPYITGIPLTYNALNTQGLDLSSSRLSSHITIVFLQITLRRFSFSYHIIHHIISYQKNLLNLWILIKFFKKEFCSHHKPFRISLDGFIFFIYFFISPEHTQHTRVCTGTDTASFGFGLRLHRFESSTFVFLFAQPKGETAWSFSIFCFPISNSNWPIWPGKELLRQLWIFSIIYHLFFTVIAYHGTFNSST